MSWTFVTFHYLSIRLRCCQNDSFSLWCCSCVASSPKHELSPPMARISAKPLHTNVPWIRLLLRPSIPLQWRTIPSSRADLWHLPQMNGGDDDDVWNTFTVEGRIKLLRVGCKCVYTQISFKILHFDRIYLAGIEQFATYYRWNDRYRLNILLGDQKQIREWCIRVSRTSILAGTMIPYFVYIPEEVRLERLSSDSCPWAVIIDLVKYSYASQRSVFKGSKTGKVWIQLELSIE